MSDPGDSKKLTQKHRHDELMDRYEGNGPELSESEMNELRSYENQTKQ